MTFGKILLACLMLALNAQASPVDLWGFGPESAATGATGVANANGYSALYLNPAGLGGKVSKRITFGWQTGSMHLDLNGQTRPVDAPTALLIGGAVPLGFGGALKDRVSIAIGVVVPPTVVNRAKSPLPGRAWFPILENRPQTVNVHLGFGVGLAKNLKLGISTLALATLSGVLDVQVDGAGRFTTVSEQQLVTRLSPIVGLQYQLPAWNLDLGLVYRGKIQSDFDIVVTNDLSSVLPVGIPEVTIAGSAQYTPAQVALEGAYHRGAFSANLQVAYQRWSQYPLPTENATANTPEQEAPGFSDTFNPRLGVSWKAKESDNFGLTLRGGYQFVFSPAPEMKGRQSFLDNHRHVASAGVGISLPQISKGMFVDTWFQWHGLVARTHDKDMSLIGPNDRVDFTTAETSGHILAGGLSLGVNY